MSRSVMRSAARPATRFFVVLTILSLLTAPVAASPGAPMPDAPGARGEAAPIQPGLLDDLRSGELDRFVVEFTAQANLDGAERINDFARRGRFVVNRLRQATTAQAAAVALVEATPGARAESYWLRNTLVVYGGAGLATAIAKLPGVKLVRAEKIYPLVKPVETQAVVLAAEPEWGVAKIGADTAWEDGILGSGIVVANVDTGVQFDHPALVNQYRGNLGGGTFDHDYNWWDPTGICGDEPCDNAGHGTHTMGTMVGGDGPGPFTPDIGVAPGANWIAAKGCEDFGCSDVSLLSAGQFILAPTDLDGNNPDPSMRPDIVNNSWGAGPGDEFYLDVVTAWRAAGIIPVFSAGNAGPGCDSGGSPGDFLESFSVGATDDNDVIADFSSRGPSAFGKINPDVAAPGVAVLSSVPGDEFAVFDGTSMAAPHVAGTLALVLSAELALVGDFEAATTAVRDTAVDILDDQCGGAEDGDPNNVYGDGRIDAAAAVALVATGGTLAGTVTDLDTADPIAGASVTASAGGRDFSATTESDGTYEMFLAAGEYAVTSVAFGYAQSAAANVTIVTDATTTHNVALDALPRFDVTGVVTAASDGTPIEGATVKAVGTPVDAAVTNPNGAFTLNLPIGSYTLRATAGGCTEQGFAEVEIIDANVEVDFSIARKIDDFGHGCAPIAFDWVDADRRTSLFGDEFVGRIHLPFNFPYYGETYDEVWVSDNGYINLLGPDQFHPDPVEIPSESDPNAAVYALWKDLHVDASGAIEFDILGSEPDRVFVLEYSNVMAGTTAVTFEIKLWENGDIDLVYADAGTGDDAGIGIENADGTDALPFGFRADVISAGSAFRFTEVPSGMVTGTVTDANDGEPIAGAVVEALGSGRSTETAADGTYQLRLLPGTYDLEIRSDGYTTHSEEITLADDDVLVVDAALEAPIAEVAPTELDATVGLGESTDMTVTVSNTGTGPLDWQVKERPTGSEPPDLPVISGAPLRIPTWEKPSVGALPRAKTTTIPSDQLSEIITDPEGDGGTVDVTTVRAGADSDEITMELNFASDADAESAVGFVFLDTDQDPETGEPPEFFFGDPAQDVGLEYFVDLFLAHEAGVVLIVDAITFEIVAETEARVVGNTLGFDVPLEAIGGDDGFVNTALVVGDIGPTDWAPDAGHGTIEPFSDAPWVAESPESGTVAAGDSVDVTVTLGGEDVDAGTYTGRLVFITSDPKTSTHFVDLSLEVTLPDGFGGASGTVLDAHSFEPLRATLAIDAELEGSPYPIEVTTRSDGSWEAFGPAGTWPMTATLDGYVTDVGVVMFSAGAMTPGQDVFLHAEQPHAIVDGGPFTVIMRPGRATTRTIEISNFDGHAPLTFETGEVNLESGAAVGAAPARRPLPAGWNPNARTTEGLGSTRVDAGALQFPGDVLAAWFTEGVDIPWGVGFTGNVWLTDAFEGGDACGFVDGCTIHEFDPEGFPTGTVLDAPWVDVFAGDMAYDAERGVLWTVHVGGENGLYAIDPADGSVEQVITGNPWDDISQRGVAYDAEEDVFYVGGWNEGVVYRVAGPSWPTPGETLSDCTPADPSISGLAWNPSFDLLWMATNSEFDDIFLIDPMTCETLSVIPHPEPGFSGAGIELDASGNLWTVSQNSQAAYLLESGLPVFSNAPWLRVTPSSGDVPVGGSETVALRISSRELTPGVYRADVIVMTNDPDASVLAVPVTLVVPSYEVGVNAGGPAYTTGGGILFRKDRTYVAGGFGHVGPSTTHSTTRAIGNTSDDPLYQDARAGMRLYRFDVPVDGIYTVQLRFAELEHGQNGQRVFTVFIEGRPVLVNLDVYRRAGLRRALNFTFETAVTDGTLNVRFSGQQGDVPMVSAILVRHRPDLEAQ
jgi:subtilisin family serine protease